MRKYIFSIIALAIIESAQAQEPPKKKSAEWYYQQGVAKSTNSFVAIDNFTKAIKKNPNYYDAYMNRASAYLSVDSIDSAVRDYDFLLNMKSLPMNQERIAHLYYLKGNALYLNSADSSACFYWRKARDLGHGNSWNQIRNNCK